MSVQRDCGVSKAIIPFPAELWGPETDEDRWELGPDPEELAWAAQAFGDDATDFDVETLDERAALEAAAVDAMAWGLIPPDVAEMVSRSGLVGLADELTTSYADEAERVSGRRPTRDEAARNVSPAWFRHSMGPMA